MQLLTIFELVHVPTLQADKAAYFEKQEELEKKNPEKARMESEMRNSKPPTGEPQVFGSL